jgi:hypothetical protein
MRGPGRPAGSKTRGKDSRKGLASGRHGKPCAEELARMAALATLASAFPAIIRTMKEADIDRLERRLEKAIGEALSRLEG